VYGQAYCSPYRSRTDSAKEGLEMKTININDIVTVRHLQGDETGEVISVNYNNNKIILAFEDGTVCGFNMLQIVKVGA
jgi:hypothetical protein